MCRTNSTSRLDIAGFNLSYRAILGLFFGFLIIFALIGNSLVCIAIWLDRKLRKNENLFLISLAASDILVAVLVMSFAAINDVYGEWIFGSYCSIWISSDVMCCTASILNLSAVSFDRYWHIRYPLKYASTMTRGKIIGIIVFIWCIAAGISFIPFQSDSSESTFNDSFPTYPFECQLSFGLTYTVVSSAVSFFVPCLVMVIAYVRMYLFAREHANMLKQQYRSIGTIVTMGLPDQAHIKNCAKQLDLSDHKASITVGIIMGVFLLCWLPFFCINILRGYNSCLVPVWAFQMVTWIGYMNSTANPVIYSIFSQDFRLAFLRLLCGRRYRLASASSFTCASECHASLATEKATTLVQSTASRASRDSTIAGGSARVVLLAKPVAPDTSSAHEIPSIRSGSRNSMRSCSRNSIRSCSRNSVRSCSRNSVRSCSRNSSFIFCDEDESSFAL